MEPQDATRAKGTTYLRTWWPAYAVFAAACALRLGLLFSTGLVPQTDGAYYLAQVRSILGGGGLRFSDTPLLFWIQALVAQVLMFTTSLDSQSATIVGVKLVDALVPPLAVLPVYALWLRWVPQERRNVLVAITVATLPALSFGVVKMAGDLQKNAFSLVLFSLTMWALDTAFRSGRKRDWALTALALSGCALSHVGVFAATLTFILPALTYRMVGGAGNRRAQARIAGGVAAVAGVAIGLLYVASLFIPKLNALGTTALSPLSLFSGETTFSRLAAGLGPDSLADAAAVLLAYAPLVAVAVLWCSQAKDSATAVTLMGASVATAALALPFLGGIDGLRLHLMAYLPAAVLFAWVTSVLRPIAVKAVCAAALLINTLAVLPVIPQATLPTIAEPSYSELLSLRDRVGQTGRTVVVARHGLEWWAAWALDADVVPTIGATPDLWSRYDTVLLLQETKVRDEASRQKRSGASPGQFRKGAAPVAGASVVFEGDWYRLSRANKPLELGREFEGEQRSGAAPRPDPLNK